MYTSSITPAMVSVAMSRSDSRDSTCSNASTTSDYRYGFTSAPQTVSYATSPLASISRTTSNTSSSSSSTSSMRRASQITQRRDSSNWIPSPYRSCQQVWEEPSSFLSDDDLLWIAPARSQPLPVTAIPGPEAARRREMTTEEQIAMLREQQEKHQEDELVRLQQQRRQAAAAAQKAVRFAPESRRRSSTPKKKTGPVVRRI